MKIKENSILWNWYCRYYQGEKVPHPSNLCRFWWTSMAGLGCKIVCDWPFLLVYPLIITTVALWVLSMTGLGQVFGNKSNTQLAFGWATMPFVFVILLSIPLLPISRLVTWAEKQKNIVQYIIYALFLGSMFCAFIFLCSQLTWRPFDWLEVVRLLSATGIFIGGFVVAALCYHFIFYPLATTEVFMTFFAYLKARKHKVCPLIEPPDSWES